MLLTSCLQSNFFLLYRDSTEAILRDEHHGTKESLQRSETDQVSFLWILRISS